METTLYITRHGETEWNVEGRLQGHEDSPLTPLGRRQASWLRDSLKDVDFDAIYTSSSGRAYQTAEILRDKRELTIIASDSLKEIYMGSWEGQKRDYIERIYPEEHNAFWKTPHVYKPRNKGESFAELQSRIIPTINEMVSRHRGGHILIVTHAVAIKVIMSDFRGDSLDKLWTPPIIQPTALNKVIVAGEVPHIEKYGDISHIQTVRRAVGAIAYQGRRFILVHKVLNTFGKHSGVWDFPKGGVEANDISLEAAVIRELAEETGTDQYVVKQQLPEKITFSFPDETRKRIGYERQETTMFLVEFIGNANDLKPLDSEIDEIKLVESNELLNHLTHEETALYIREHVDIPFRPKP